MPAQGARRAAYLKCTTRAVHDWPALGVAVSLDARRHDRARRARRRQRRDREAAHGSPAPSRCCAAARAGDALFQQAGEAAAEEAELITDGQGSAAYKKQLVRVYVARALARAR